MFLSPPQQRIFVADYVVDFRRAHDGLLAEAYRLKLDPFQGDLLVFVGRKKNRIKILYADSTGLWISWKQFTMEAIKTQFRFLSDPSCRLITVGELSMLLEGSSYILSRRVKSYSSAHHSQVNNFR